ncbi:MAG: hypothetical protein OXC46_05650 [Thaumarchaeota archaeon]|nr:hypothetical protein [Nitrososphaerota archaeon]
MTRYIIPILASATVLAVLAITFVAWSPDDIESNTQQNDITHDGEPLEIVTVLDDEQIDTTFRTIPPLGTKAHDEWIEWYRTAEYDGRNGITRDIAIVFHDFEVKFNPDHDGPDVSGVAVALLIQLDRLSDDYDPTVNERLVHDWYIAEHDPPSDPAEIYASLLGIVGTADNIHHAEALYNATNVGAYFGDVPYDLHMQDVEYWHYEAMFASCEHFWDDCDASSMRASVATNRDLTDEEIEDFNEQMEQDSGLSVDTSYTAFDAVTDDGIIPVAWASIVSLPKQNHAYLVLWSDRDTCTHYAQTKCSFDQHDNGIGWNSVFPASTDWHDAYGGSSHASGAIHYSSSVSANYSPVAISQYVYITAQFKVPDTSSSTNDYGTITAHVSDKWNPPGSGHSYGAKARTYASVTYN